MGTPRPHMTKSLNDFFHAALDPEMVEIKHKEALRIAARLETKRKMENQTTQETKEHETPKNETLKNETQKNETLKNETQKNETSKTENLEKQSTPAQQETKWFSHAKPPLVQLSKLAKNPCEGLSGTKLQSCLKRQERREEKLTPRPQQ